MPRIIKLVFSQLQESHGILFIHTHMYAKTQSQTDVEGMHVFAYICVYMAYINVGNGSAML